MLYFKYNNNNNMPWARNLSSKGKGHPMACLCRHKWEAVA